MKGRFQIRRWPDGCPPMIGGLAVVDALHRGRIVRTYDGRTPGYDAIGAAQADCARWNARPPALVMRLPRREIVAVRQQDGTVRLEQKRTEKPSGISDESSYTDYRYVGLDAEPGTTSH